jgi:hypothetical protein
MVDTITHSITQAGQADRTDTEELLAAGHAGAEYDACLIEIVHPEQSPCH